MRPESPSLTQEVRLSHLAASLGGEAASEHGDVCVTGVSHDHRAVARGDLFACLVGKKHDGHTYARMAMEAGAAALLIQRDRQSGIPSEVPAIIVESTRLALAQAASIVYDKPSRKIRLIGVTGTNGKSTSTCMIASILRAAGFSTGTIGTLGAELSGQHMDIDRTTPEADDLQRLLAGMLRRGANAVVMEVSSIAISEHRVDELEFDAGVFTNLSQDHLDYHFTMAEYFAEKRKLFSEFPMASSKPFIASINCDDPRGVELAAATKGRVITFGRSPDAQVQPGSIAATASSLQFTASTPVGDVEVNLPFGGSFQVSNALAAVTSAIGLGIPIESISNGLSTMTPVPGRFEPINNNRGFDVIVDYAHSPDGLSNLLRSARLLNPKRIITVFGCGGDRDKTKRPIMGNIVGALSDVAIVTSDNPRTEEPRSIIDEIVVGLAASAAECHVEPDRRRAIAMAIGMAEPGCIVLIAGKGHETYQIIGDKTFPFDDRQVAREVLGQ